MNDVAVVGMECLFPGAGDLAAFWRNIVCGFDATSDVPPSRWDPEECHFLKGRRGAFVEGLTDFDPIAHGLMPAALKHGDPEHFLAYRVILFWLPLLIGAVAFFFMQRQVKAIEAQQALERAQANS